MFNKKKSVMNEKEESVFFRAGDVVRVEDLHETPEMLVRGREFDDDKSFLGIRCMWFDTNNVMQEGIFNTKELVKVRDRKEKAIVDYDD